MVKRQTLIGLGFCVGRCAECVWFLHLEMGSIRFMELGRIVFFSVSGSDMTTVHALKGGGEFLRRLQKEEEVQQSLRRESRRPKYSRFSQQELGSCKPMLTPRCTVAMFVSLGVMCIAIGVYALLASWSVVELVNRYDIFCIMKYATHANPMITVDEKIAFMQDATKRKNCTITMDVTKLMKQPIYVYYQLGNYFQNHRRYVKSKSERQLRGLAASSSELNDCKPEDQVNGEVIVPCGLIAWTLFNDTYDLSTNGFSSDNGTVFVNKTAIAWKSDREERFNNTVFPTNFPNNNRTTLANASQIGGGWLNESLPLSKNENLMVWMRTAALPTFRKLYGRIETDLQPGTKLTINIENYYNAYGFGGSKKLVLSTASWIGGRNDFLGLSYIVVGCASILMGLVFLYVHWKNPRPLGDRSYLSWVRKSPATSTVTS
ncbi:hypothetical protein KC19_7G096200 [Ceratodon purpureus]|nr:hypothetical protein KC19_7G096200 [Ceratodon purpureus]